MKCETCKDELGSNSLCVECIMSNPEKNKEDKELIDNMLSNLNNQFNNELFKTQLDYDCAFGVCDYWIKKRRLPKQERKK